MKQICVLCFLIVLGHSFPLYDGSSFDGNATFDAKIFQDENDRPIIGILAQEFENDISEFKLNMIPPVSYIAASYIKFVEVGGARAIPIMINQPKEYYEEVFRSINGLLIPGGGAGVVNSGYSRAGKILFDLAIKANEEGDYFPIWATCLGFELLSAFTAGKDILTKCDSNNVALPLEYTDSAEQSVMYGTLPDDIREKLGTLPTTMNFHNFCLTYENFTKYGLDEFYNILSYNKDANGLTFISTMEAKKFPFYAVQYHPEKNLFEWNNTPWFNNIPHSQQDIRVMQSLANFFVDQTRKNYHHFKSEKDENELLIYNYQATFTQPFGNSFSQIYFFPF